MKLQPISLSMSTKPAFESGRKGRFLFLERSSGHVPEPPERPEHRSFIVVLRNSRKKKKMAKNHPDYPMWSALLRWSLKQQDGTEASPQKELSAEDRKFLEEALKDVTVDEAQELGVILQKIDDGDDETLVDLEELVERLDLARDLCKMGGMTVVLKAVKRGSAAACAVVGTAAQNDQESQDAIAAEGGLEALVQAFDHDDSDLKRAAVAGISALIRGNGALETQFLELGTGAFLLTSALRGPPRLASKAAFLLYALLYDASEDRVEHLDPALRAAVQRSTEPESDDDNNNTTVVQLRESSTKALVEAFKAHPTWVLTNLGDDLRSAAKHILAHHPTDDDLTALWRDNFPGLLA